MVKNNNKNIVIVAIVAVVLALLVGYFVFAYLPKQEKIDRANTYKAALYESMLCQYGCPLENQVLGNVSGYLPSTDCINNCTSQFKGIDYDVADISEKDAANDNLLNDISDVMNACKRESTTNTSVNSQMFFSCTKQALEDIKGKYSYLN